MRIGAGIVALSLGLAFLPGGLRGEEQEGTENGGQGTKAESLVPVASKPRTRMQDQVNRLLREQAGMVSPAPALEENTAEANAEETLQLEPMIVEGKRELAWPPPLRENKLQEVLRTGTLWKKVGPRFTKAFWIKGDRGIGFTLSW